MSKCWKVAAKIQSKCSQREVYASIQPCTGPSGDGTDPTSRTTCIVSCCEGGCTLERGIRGIESPTYEHRSEYSNHEKNRNSTS